MEIEMSEKKIIIPEGMLEAAHRAIANIIPGWCQLDYERAAIEAALRWLDEKLEEMGQSNRYEGKLTAHAAMVEVWREGVEDVRRMFFAPESEWMSTGPLTRADFVGVLRKYNVGELVIEKLSERLFGNQKKPEIPEAIKDLLVADPSPSKWSGDEFNSAVLEAYRRGQERK
jgi:hypothetical protein